jgi:molybdopterin synthase catalytic subunit/molybdopterin converting factor small subunit
MRVRVLFFGILKDVAGRAEETVETAEGVTVGDLFSGFCQRFETLAVRRPSILFARNGEFVKPDAGISEGDEVAFLPPVSGGSDASGERPIVEITREPIDSQTLSRRLQRPEDGAVVLFEGVVRNNSNGREALYLDYECYEAMALAQMRRIAEEIAAAAAVGRIGVVHRLGRLKVGEISVAIVVTAPHRKPAFEAALTCINRLKQEVPIWKKEYFADGAVWVEGEWADALRSAPEAS